MSTSFKKALRIFFLVFLGLMAEMAMLFGSVYVAEINPILGIIVIAFFVAFSMALVIYFNDRS